MNVHHLSILLIAPLISGCMSFGWKSTEPIEVRTKAAERTRLNLADPTPLQPRVPKWILVTPENAEQVFNSLKEQNVDLVLFALTDEGYEELALNIAELRNFIASQRAIIIKYKDYYEPSKETNSK